MGRARSASDALEAEVVRLSKNRDKAAAEMDVLFDEVAKKQALRAEAEARLNALDAEIKARERALMVLRGEQLPLAIAVGAVIAEHIDTSAITEGMLPNPDQPSGVFAQLPDDETLDEQDKTPVGTKAVEKHEKGLKVKTLAKGENPLQALERMRAPETGRSAADNE